MDDLKSISCVTYNMHGFNQGECLLLELLDKYDIICVQEHWLFTSELCRLSDMTTSFLIHSISAMDDNVMSDFIRGRPFG